MKVKIPSINVSIGHTKRPLMNESMNFSEMRETQETIQTVHNSPGYFDEVGEWEQELIDEKKKHPVKYEAYSKSRRVKKK